MPMRRLTHCPLLSLSLSLLAALLAPCSAAADEASYTLAPDEYGMALKTPEGKTVFVYMTKRPADTELTANSVCCLYPVFTPAGVRAVDFAPDDHRHHRGVFLAWRSTTFGGRPADFWGPGSETPDKMQKISNRAVELLESDAERAVVRVENDWMIGDEVVLDEQTQITAGGQRGVYVLDFDYRLTPKVDMQLHQFAYTGFVVRARKDGQAKYFTPRGEIDLPSPHHLKPETNWPAAPWYNYVVELESGETVGTAVVDHPDNPPATWHNVKPIALVNPCIAAPAAVERKAGELLRLRYRVIVHDGPVPAALIDGLARAWRQ
jgi:hypothetical protein